MPTAHSDQLTHSQRDPCAPQCLCPVCRGLECLERPRFFAGQLLSETELNSLQNYVLAKNRLHNRYLHGWGVVCGLAVVCHDCKGFVRVSSGYALDPCGNDIVVCKDRDFNVVEEIARCIDARRRHDEECPPWRDVEECKDDEEHWCITLEYLESETRSVMPLQEKKSHCGCGGACGCGGTSKKCGCGGKSEKKNGNGRGCSCEKKSATPTRPAACEPTRVLEQYRLGVVRAPQGCKSQLKKGQIRRDNGKLFLDVSTKATADELHSAQSALMGMMPAKLASSSFVAALLAVSPPNGLLTKVMFAAKELRDFLDAYFSKAELKALGVVFRRCREAQQNTTTLLDFDGMFTSKGGEPPADVQEKDLCCRLRTAIRELYLDNPLNIRCVPFDCPPCKPTEGSPNDPAGGNQFETMCCLLDALIQYFVDAVCMAILPPCPPDPCDNRLIIACVTIKDGKVIRICNHACRRYAGSFNSVEYWASAVPVIPLIAAILREVCCAANGFAAAQQLWSAFTTAGDL